MLWGNMHLAFLYGLGLIGCYLAGELIDAWLPVVYGTGPAGRHDRARDFAVILILGLGATMLNPYSARLYDVLVLHRRDLLLLQETISEWTMPEVGLPYLRPYWAVMAFSFTAALWHFVRTRRTPPAHLLALGGFALASASHVRHLPYMALTGLMLAGAACVELPIPRRFLTRAGALLMAALAVHIIWGILPACLPWKQLCLRNGEALASFLESNSAALGRGRLYNQWGDGGYLGFRLRGSNPVYFDGRYIFHELLFETRAAFRDAASWRKLMNEKGVQVALFRRLESHGSREALPLAGGAKRAVVRPFYVRYMPREDWALVYWDEHDFVMVRRSAVDKKWIAQREYKWLWPEDWDRLDWQLKSGRAPKREVAAEAERAGKETPGLKSALGPLTSWLGTLP
jgi:hypothetical protein